MAKNTKIKINNSRSLFGNKKRMGILLFAFAAVGTAILIRSFAATQIITFNPGLNVQTNTIPGLAFKKTKAAIETTTVNGTTVSNTFALVDGTNNTNADPNITYTTKLNPGYYRACFTAKRTTDPASAFLYVKYATENLYYNYAYGTDIFGSQATDQPTKIVVPKNTLKEFCEYFSVFNYQGVKDYTISFTAYNYASPSTQNFWRVNNFKLDLVDRKEFSKDTLTRMSSKAISSFGSNPGSNGASASIGSFAQATPANITYGVDFSEAKDNIRLTTDTQYLPTEKILAIGDATNKTVGKNTLSASVSMPNNLTSTKNYKFCVSARPLSMNSTARMSASTFTTGNTKPVEDAGAISFKPGSASDLTRYKVICKSHTSIKLNQSLTFTFAMNPVTSANPAGTGTGWYVSDAWVEEI